MPNFYFIGNKDNLGIYVCMFIIIRWDQGSRATLDEFSIFCNNQQKPSARDGAEGGGQGGGGGGGGRREEGVVGSSGTILIAQALSGVQ